MDTREIISLIDNVISERRALDKDTKVDLFDHLLKNLEGYLYHITKTSRDPLIAVTNFEVGFYHVCIQTILGLDHGEELMEAILENATTRGVRDR